MLQDLVYFLLLEHVMLLRINVLKRINVNPMGGVQLLPGIAIRLDLHLRFREGEMGAL